MSCLYTYASSDMSSTSCSNVCRIPIPLHVPSSRVNQWAPISFYVHRTITRDTGCSPSANTVAESTLLFIKARKLDD